MWETFDQKSRLIFANRRLRRGQVVLVGSSFGRVMPCWLVCSCTTVGHVCDANDEQGGVWVLTRWRMLRSNNTVEELIRRSDMRLKGIHFKHNIYRKHFYQSSSSCPANSPVASLARIVAQMRVSVTKAPHVSDPTNQIPRSTDRVPDLVSVLSFAPISHRL